MLLERFPRAVARAAYLDGRSANLGSLYENAAGLLRELYALPGEMRASVPVW